MAGDASPRVGPGYPGLPAKSRNQHVIRVAFVDDRQAIEEQQINYLASLWIGKFHALRPKLPPVRYVLAHQWVDWLREGRCSFIYWHIEHADRCKPIRRSVSPLLELPHPGLSLHPAKDFKWHFWSYDLPHLGAGVGGKLRGEEADEFMAANLAWKIEGEPYSFGTGFQFSLVPVARIDGGGALFCGGKSWKLYA